MNAVENAQVLHAPTRIVSWWLSGIYLMVLAMVLVGGITRLTGSGLSMVEWRPLMGAFPPVGEQAWLEVFAKYKQSPQYQLVNQWMTLADFKRIFFWEYIHRLLGRGIGLVFLGPWLWFLFRRQIVGRMVVKTGIAFVLGGLQGLLGWYMVKSGLVDRPSVSHLRLAAHLALAVFLAHYILWLIFDLRRGSTTVAQSPPPRGRVAAWGVVGVLAVQIVWGAFMAGLRAGHLFSSWPLMGGVVWPSGSFQQGGFFVSMVMDPVTVHVVHRWFAWVVVGVVAWFAWPRVSNTMGQRVLLLIVVLQFALGAATVLLHIPTAVAVVHQGVGFLCLSAAVLCAYERRDVGQPKELARQTG